MAQDRQHGMSESEEAIKVATLYHFCAIPVPELLREELTTRLAGTGIMGTILVAAEGINLTVAGSPREIDEFLIWLQAIPSFSAAQSKISYASEPPFLRMKVRLKKEIVSLGVDGVDPNQLVGEYIDPADWNALITDPEVTLIDTRNRYEVSIGSFAGAIDPNTTSFRSFPDFVEASLDPKEHPKIAMYCTGGIRCEKASSFLLSQGFSEVYHLHGGILSYLENVPESESLWQGECFVFDDRVAVNHELEPGSYDLCRACRMPLSDDDKRHPDYESGVSCRYCRGIRSDDDRIRYQEREKQVSLAASRGEKHIGSAHQQSGPGES